ncbi:MAG TPA: P63C domain-containing protein [Pyrinomonadaceae bacterium]
MSENVTGKAKGAKVLAEMMTPEERTERAKKAAQARWGERVPKATHKGNFKEEFGFDVECYVLDDENKTAVIHQRGMGAALGFSSQSGGRLPRFIGGKNISPYIGPELRRKLENPIVFQGLDTVSGDPSSIKLHGFDVTLLIDVCKAIVAADAEGKLTPSQKGIAAQAHIILNASAKAGIKGLVYALSGYDATREEVIAAFKLYVREEAREYEKEFPPQLYAQWYRLYELPKPERSHPWKFKTLTVNQVYVPLARSKGKIHELIVALKAASGDRRKKLHQFLSEVGVKVLRTHLGQLLGIAQISRDKSEYERHVNFVFGDQQEFDFGDPTYSTSHEQPFEQ